jgi:hypothetical protein
MSWFLVLYLHVCLAVSLAKELLSPTDMALLEQKLKKVAGVYTDEALVKKYHLEKTVVITGCNHGFLNHLFNFDCFMRRLGMKYLVITMDKDAETELRKHPHIETFLMAGEGEIHSTAQEFRSKQFNLITTRKKAAVHSIMQLGFDVLFSDTDVAIVRDPFPYLLWDNVDYVHSVNAFCLT